MGDKRLIEWATHSIMWPPEPLNAINYVSSNIILVIEVLLVLLVPHFLAQDHRRDCLTGGRHERWYQKIGKSKSSFSFDAQSCTPGVDEKGHASDVCPLNLSCQKGTMIDFFRSAPWDPLRPRGWLAAGKKEGPHRLLFRRRNELIFRKRQLDAYSHTTP